MEDGSLGFVGHELILKQFRYVDSAIRLSYAPAQQYLNKISPFSGSKCITSIEMETNCTTMS